MEKNLEIAGVWHNEHRSQIDLSCSINGQITGAFLTKKNPGEVKEYPLTGYVHGDLIAFCVNFAEQGAVTAWVGQIQSEAQSTTLRTLWHMSIEVEKYGTLDDRSWKSILSGADTFYKGPAIFDCEKIGDTQGYALYPPYLLSARKNTI